MMYNDYDEGWDNALYRDVWMMTSAKQQKQGWLGILQLHAQNKIRCLFLSQKGFLKVKFFPMFCFV